MFDKDTYLASDREEFRDIINDVSSSHSHSQIFMDFDDTVELGVEVLNKIRMVGTGDVNVRIGEVEVREDVILESFTVLPSKMGKHVADLHGNSLAVNDCDFDMGQQSGVIFNVNTVSVESCSFHENVDFNKECSRIVIKDCLSYGETACFDVWNGSHGNGGEMVCIIDGLRGDPDQVLFSECDVLASNLNLEGGRVVIKNNASFYCSDSTISHFETQGYNTGSPDIHLKDVDILELAKFYEKHKDRGDGGGNGKFDNIEVNKISASEGYDLNIKGSFSQNAY